VTTLANIAEKFKPGEVYNIAGKDLHNMKEASDIILKYLGKDDSLVEYRDMQEDTTLLKRVDASKASRDLGHKSTVTLEEGIPKTIEWQKEVYGLG
jgi:dTDP-glucose 4,6-dehydratase